ncbi:MAG: hypothetical protein AVDCRST_MAG19-4987, partial [uncultured Thermomicrobiales bacterium]
AGEAEEEVAAAVGDPVPDRGRHHREEPGEGDRDRDAEVV